MKRGRFLTENNLSRADVTVRNAKKKKSSLVWMAIMLDGHLNVQEEIKPETVTVWVHYSHVPHPLIQPRVGWKYSGKKNFHKVSKSKTWICNTLATIYIALTLLDIISDLEMISRIQEDAHRVHESTTPFYVRNEYMQTWYHGCLTTNSLWTPRDD